MLEPNVGLLVFPKLKVDPVLLLLPKALLVLALPNPPVELPKGGGLFVELPNKPPPVLVVLEPNGFEAGLLPKSEPEVLALLPKPVVDGVVSPSISSVSETGGSEGVEVEREREG